MDSLVGQDLRITLPGQPADPAAGPALQTLIEGVGRIATGCWPDARWEWMHGPSSAGRCLAALAARLAGHVDGTENDTSAYWSPLGAILATGAGGRAMAWKIELHANWRGPWGVAIEPRLRRRLLGLLTSDRIPGRKELPAEEAAPFSEALRRMAGLGGDGARFVPADAHWQRRAVLVFP